MLAASSDLSGAPGWEVGQHRLCEGAWAILVLGSFLPAMASFSKALLSLPGPEGRQHDSGLALTPREPTVPLGREPGQGLPAEELRSFIEVMSRWVWWDAQGLHSDYVGVKGGHAEQEGEK